LILETSAHLIINSRTQRREKILIKKIQKRIYIIQSHWPIKFLIFSSSPSLHCYDKALGRQFFNDKKFPAIWIHFVVLVFASEYTQDLPFRQRKHTHTHTQIRKHSELILIDYLLRKWVYLCRTKRFSPSLFMFY
jgi:hypothetical protein